MKMINTMAAKVFKNTDSRVLGMATFGAVEVTAVAANAMILLGDGQMLSNVGAVLSILLYLVTGAAKGLVGGSAAFAKFYGALGGIVGAIVGIFTVIPIVGGLVAIATQAIATVAGVVIGLFLFVMFPAIGIPAALWIGREKEEAYAGEEV